MVESTLIESMEVDMKAYLCPVLWAVAVAVVVIATERILGRPLIQF